MDEHDRALIECVRRDVAWQQKTYGRACPHLSDAEVLAELLRGPAEYHQGDTRRAHQRAYWAGVRLDRERGRGR